MLHGTEEFAIIKHKKDKIFSDSLLTNFFSSSNDDNILNIDESPTSSLVLYRDSTLSDIDDNNIKI